MYLQTFFHILHVKKNKNSLREFEPQNGKIFNKTQAEFKNAVSYKKKGVFYRSFIERNLQKCFILSTNQKDKDLNAISLFI